MTIRTTQHKNSVIHNRQLVVNSPDTKRRGQPLLKTAAATDWPFNRGDRTSVILVSKKIELSSSSALVLKQKFYSVLIFKDIRILVLVTSTGRRRQTDRQTMQYVQGERACSAVRPRRTSLQSWQHKSVTRHTTNNGNHWWSSCH